MKKLKIVADEKIPFLKGVLEPYADVRYQAGSLITKESIMDADALLIRTRTKCNHKLLEGTSIMFIGTATIGYDHIDVDYCKSGNITWANAPGCNSASVQQYIVAALLEIAAKNDFSLSEKTLGIVGVGNVGSLIHKAAVCLGMKVKLNDPPRSREKGAYGFVSLDEILETCDIGTVHVPLNRLGLDKTFHLFDSEMFRKMKAGSWLINSSRGEVVETEALKKALTTGKLAGTVLDVWENEPEIDLQLLSMASISTPHIAGYSVDGKANGTAQIVKSLSSFFNLPIHDFYPSTIPQPEVPELMIDGSGKTPLQIVYEAVLSTYPIIKDHSRLQSSPLTFELQRGQYPARREFAAYKLRPINCNPETLEMLATLGFEVVS